MPTASVVLPHAAPLALALVPLHHMRTERLNLLLYRVHTFLLVSWGENSARSAVTDRIVPHEPTICAFVRRYYIANIKTAVHITPLELVAEYSAFEINFHISFLLPFLRGGEGVGNSAGNKFIFVHVIIFHIA